MNFVRFKKKCYVETLKGRNFVKLNYKYNFKRFYHVSYYNDAGITLKKLQFFMNRIIDSSNYLFNNSIKKETLKVTKDYLLNNSIEGVGKAVVAKVETDILLKNKNTKLSKLVKFLIKFYAISNPIIYFFQKNVFKIYKFIRWFNWKFYKYKRLREKIINFFIRCELIIFRIYYYYYKFLSILQGQTLMIIISVRLLSLVLISVFITNIFIIFINKININLLFLFIIIIVFELFILFFIDFLPDIIKKKLDPLFFWGINLTTIEYLRGENGKQIAMKWRGIFSKECKWYFDFMEDFRKQWMKENLSKEEYNLILKQIEKELNDFSEKIGNNK